MTRTPMTAAEHPETYDVFLSHSSNDKNWADAACAVLEKHRIRCWIAPRDIVPGDEWGAAIIKGINASRILVLIFSEHANASAQVRREVERAISRGLPVLPVRIQEVRPQGAMEYALGNTHWLDAFTPPVERQLELVAKSVATLLGQGTAEVPGTIGTAAAPRSAPAASNGNDSSTTTSRKRYGYLLGGTLAAIIAVLLLTAFLKSERANEQDVQKTSFNESTVQQPPVTTETASADKDVEIKLEAAPLEPINILGKIKPGGPRPKQNWELRRGALCSTGTGSDVFRFPVEAPLEYKIEMNVARVRPGGRSDFAVGLVCGQEGHCAVLLDGWGGTISGLSYVDGKVAAENETKYEGHIFNRGQPSHIVITVRRGSIHVTADDKTIVDWRGRPSRLSLVPAPRAGLRLLTITSVGAHFRIDQLVLTPLVDLPPSPSKTASPEE